MKNQEIISQIGELPKFLSEDWIEKAIKKLDKSRMSPEQRMHFEMMLAKNASIVAREEEKRKKEIAEAQKATATNTATEMKKANEPIEKIIKYTGLTREEIEKL